MIKKEIMLIDWILFLEHFYNKDGKEMFKCFRVVTETGVVKQLVTEGGETYDSAYTMLWTTALALKNLRDLSIATDCDSINYASVLEEQAEQIMDDYYSWSALKWALDVVRNNRTG